MPLISVIILTWNGIQKGLLEECLSSVLPQADESHEIIVVDNGSSDETVSWVREHVGDAVRLIAIPENQGYAEGNNVGIREAKGQWIVLLSNDTAVDPSWLAEIAAAIARHPDAGMFTPKILNYYRRDEIDNTGHIIYPDGLARGHHRIERDDGRFDEEREALSPSGCSGVYRRELLEQVGPLDGTFFAYCEDVDLGLRARWAGWRCWYIPRAVLYHKYSATMGGYSAFKVFLVERNRIWSLLKNFPQREILLSPFYTFYRYLMHLKGALSGQGAAGKFAGEFPVWLLFWTTVKAILAGLGGAPRILRERRRLAPTRKLSSGEFRELLSRYRLTAVEAALKE